MFYDKLQANGVKSFLVEVPEGGHGFNMYTKENLQKMVEWFNSARLDPKSSILEKGGTGAYPAIMKEEASLKAHTIFCPQDLSKFNKKNPLPVLVWGNGACNNSPFEMVIATGYYPAPGVNGWKYERSVSEQQLESIDWIMAQNSDKNSPYFGKINVKKICVAGMSCGGLQTLTNSADPRISTLMIMNSGLFNNSNAASAIPGMPMPSKDKLNEIKVPIMYVLGGKDDIAYENGMDDFKRINHVTSRESSTFLLSQLTILLVMAAHTASLTVASSLFLLLHGLTGISRVTRMRLRCSSVMITECHSARIGLLRRMNL